MSNAPQTETSVVTNAETEAQAKVKANAARAAKALAKAQAFHAKVIALIKEGSELLADDQDALAGMLGESADLKGYPLPSHFLAFQLAIASAKLKYERHADLCRKANARCKDNGKPVAKITSKTRTDKGRQEFSLNPPAMLADI